MLKCVTSLDNSTLSNRSPCERVSFLQQEKAVSFQQEAERAASDTQSKEHKGQDDKAPEEGKQNNSNNNNSDEVFERPFSTEPKARTTNN